MTPCRPAALPACCTTRLLGAAPAIFDACACAAVACPQQHPEAAGASGPVLCGVQRPGLRMREEDEEEVEDHATDSATSRLTSTRCLFGAFLFSRATPQPPPAKPRASYFHVGFAPLGVWVFSGSTHCPDVALSSCLLRAGVAAARPGTPTPSTKCSSSCLFIHAPWAALALVPLLHFSSQ